MEDFSKNTTENRDQVKSDFTGQNLGIAALITAIITFVLAVIPCVGIIAIIPGIIAIVLASVGLSQAGKNRSPRGLLVAGLIIGIVASLISLSQIFVTGKLAKHAEKRLPGDIQNIIQDVRRDVLRDLEDASISIKVESNGDKIEINTGTDRNDRIEKLEELEGVKHLEEDEIRDTVPETE
jgi:hypothetical protein